MEALQLATSILVCFGSDLTMLWGGRSDTRVARSASVDSALMCSKFSLAFTGRKDIFGQPLGTSMGCVMPDLLQDLAVIQIKMRSFMSASLEKQQAMQTCMALTRCRIKTSNVNSLSLQQRILPRGTQLPLAQKLA